ncbi:MAG: hypothetical protein PVH87_21550 [Desulfobacteraceae bacterium]|jgi:hypothetical protein
MKHSRWMTLSAAIAAMALSAATALVPGLADADQRRLSHTISSERWGNLQPVGGSIRPDNGWHDRIVISRRDGRWPSMEDGDKPAGLDLGTAVVLKPLQTDRFTVAFAAGKPLGKMDTCPTTERFTGPKMRMHASDNQIRLNTISPDRRIEWLIFANMAGVTPFKSIVLEPPVNGVSSASMEVGWTSKVTLIFMPADQWTVRALVSMGHHGFNTISPLSAEAIDQPSIGMAIGVDYKILESVRLDFGYGLFRNDCRFETALSDSGKTDDLADKGDHPEIQIFSARLKIEF